MTKSLCNELIPSIHKNVSDEEAVRLEVESKSPNLTLLDLRYTCYKKYLDIGYDRDYCDVTTESQEAFYDCLQKNKIDTKGDYCIFKNPGALVFLGADKSYHDCMLDHGIPPAASHCNFKLKEFQENDYFDNTTWSFSEIETCLEPFKIPTDFLRC